MALSGATTQQLNGVLAELESGEGTAGLLLNDPGMYRDTRALLARFDSPTVDFQRNPRKHINLSSSRLLISRASKRRAAPTTWRPFATQH
jgi:hypothetical protein